MNYKQKTILGVKVDSTTLDEAVSRIEGWLKKGGKHYIVTTNVEFIIAAQKDPEFKNILNRADLSISDSNRLNWAYRIKRENNLGKKLLLWPLFLIPNILEEDIAVLTGVDLMDKLCGHFSKKPVTIGLLGGMEGLAEDTAKCLQQKHPGLKISFAKSGGKVSKEGEAVKINLPKTDFLFVAFGQIKQEKWIAKNIDRVDAKVFMGVGGAFDYLSNRTPRAPLVMRKLGLEWLYRLFKQPWRIKRFGNLVKFVFLTF